MLFLSNYEFYSEMKFQFQNLVSLTFKRKSYNRWFDSYLLISLSLSLVQVTSSGFVPLALSPHFSLLEFELAVVQGQITAVDTGVNLTLLNAVVQTGGPLDFVSVVSGSQVLRQGPVKNIDL